MRIDMRIDMRITSSMSRDDPFNSIAKPGGKRIFEGNLIVDMVEIQRVRHQAVVQLPLNINGEDRSKDSPGD
ncbi:hypothetical protein I7I48_05146 [Histoplasma ohiense]|nr:hypothetical protein I7I48_05146 [Histoplasma ohiense (nom. inval.)]